MKTFTSVLAFIAVSASIVSSLALPDGNRVQERAPYPYPAADKFHKRTAATGTAPAIPLSTAITNNTAEANSTAPATSPSIVDGTTPDLNDIVEGLTGIDHGSIGLKSKGQRGSRGGAGRGGAGHGGAGNAGAAAGSQRGKGKGKGKGDGKAGVNGGAGAGVLPPVDAVATGVLPPAGVAAPTGAVASGIFPANGTVATGVAAAPVATVTPAASGKGAEEAAVDAAEKQRTPQQKWRNIE